MNKLYFSIVLLVFGMTTSSRLHAEAYGSGWYGEIQAMVIHEDNISRSYKSGDQVSEVISAFSFGGGYSNKIGTKSPLILSGYVTYNGAMIEAGARDVGREIDRDQFYTTSLAAMIVLDDGEAVDSDRVKHHCGAMVMAAVHYAYDQWRNFGHQPPGHMAEIWGDYTAMLEGFPEERRHQRIHAGHNCWVLPEEEKFVTKPLLQRTCMIGTQDQLLERLQELSDAGLNQVMNLPSYDPRFEVLERIAKDIIPNL